MKSTNKVSKKTTLIIASVAAFITPFMGSSVNIALPSIGQQFSMDAVLLNWVATSYLLAAAVFLVPFGRIADIHGRKKVFLSGMFIYTLSSLLCAVSTSTIFLISSRILQGIGSAMIFSTGIAILTSVFPMEERGKVLGINIAAVYLGLSLGPFLGGILTQHLGWRSLFFINIPLGLLAIGLVLWRLKGDWAEARGEKFDLLGTIFFSISLIAIMYGFSVLPAMAGVWAIIFGVLGLLAFVRWELKTKSPVLDINLFKRNTVFTYSNMAALISYSATFAVAFLLSLYLQYIKGFSPQTAGIVLVSQPVVMTIFSPLAGRISDRVEPRVVASIGMALTFLSLCLLTFLSETTTVQFIVMSLIILGFGLALFSSPNTNAIMSSVEKRFYGVASGMVGTTRLIGQTLSMGIAMLVFTLYIGRVEITPEYYSSFMQSVRIIFTIAACLCFCGIFASLVRGRVRQ